jgi:O-antigen/teichoic acid export membrane protein
MILGMTIRGLGDLFKDTAVYGIASALPRAVSLIMLPVLSRHLSPEQFGEIGVSAVLAQVLTAIFSLGFGTAFPLAYMAKDDRHAKARAFTNGIMSLIACITILGTAGCLWIAYAASSEWSQIIAWTIASSALGMLCQPFQLSYQLDGLARRYAVLSVAAALVTSASVAWMVAGLGLGTIGFLEAQFIGQGFTILLYCDRLRLFKRATLEVSRVAWFARTGVAVIPSFASLALLQQNGRLALQHYAGLATVGHYTVGFNIGMAMALAVSGFQSSWAAYMFQRLADDEQATSRDFSRVFIAYALGFGWLSLLFVVLAEPALAILSTPRYLEARFALAMTAVGQFLVGLYNLLLPGLYFAKELWGLTAVQGVAALLGLMITLLLTHAFGLPGAAVAHAMGYAGLVAIQWAWNRWRGYRYAQPISWRVLVIGSVTYICLVTAGLVVPTSGAQALVLNGTLLAGSAAIAWTAGLRSGILDVRTPS